MGVIVALGMGFLTFSNRGATDPNATPRPVPTPAPMTPERFDVLLSKTRHLKGNKDARYTVIEFADFQCPMCRKTHDQITKKFGHEIQEVRFGFRHFPLETIHPFAMAAAVAAEFGDKGGKFWEVYEELLKNPDTEPNNSVIEQAVFVAKLDSKEYQKKKNDADLEKLVRADLQDGIDLGVNETPTFFILDAKTKKVTTVVGPKKLAAALEGIAGVPNLDAASPSPAAPPTQ